MDVPDDSVSKILRCYYRFWTLLSKMIVYRSFFVDLKGVGVTEVRRARHVREASSERQVAPLSVVMRWPGWFERFGLSYRSIDRSIGLGLRRAEETGSLPVFFLPNIAY